jgi:PKD repeat protein
MGQEALEPQVAMDAAGDGVAVWWRANGTNAVVQSATGSVDGPWGVTTELSVTGQNATEPHVAIDPAGEAVATWQGYDGTGYMVQADGYDVAGPQLRGLSIPTTGSAGASLSFSVSPLDVWSAVGATTWSFGDGGTAVGTAVSHTYAGPGTYAVKLSSTDAVGNTSTANGTVTVPAEPSFWRSRAGAAPGALGPLGSSSP